MLVAIIAVATDDHLSGFKGEASFIATHSIKGSKG
jgi:hypothetical protein